jgi:hypothetical protein
LIQDHIGDPITIVTKRTRGPQGIWTLTGDIRIRFSSSKSAKHAYEQQRVLNHVDKDTSRLLTHNGSVSPFIIPTGHMGEESDDPPCTRFSYLALISEARTTTHFIHSYMTAYQKSMTRYCFILMITSSSQRTSAIDIIATSIAEAATANKKHHHPQEHRPALSSGIQQTLQG